MLVLDNGWVMSEMVHMIFIECVYDVIGSKRSLTFTTYLKTIILKRLSMVSFHTSMKKVISILMAIALVFSSLSIVLTQPNALAANSDKSVKVPPNAVKVAENVYSLGKAKDVTGKVVEGFMIIHPGPKKESAKPLGAGGGKGGEPKCFAFLASGAKWKSIEPWVVNPANTEGLQGNFVLTNLDSDIQKWEDTSGKNILGDGTSTSNTLVADTASPDGSNEVYFGDVGSAGSIAVTIVWGIFSGSPSQRQLVEWDQVYDQVDFNWSAAGEAGMMDFENIATHEIGHSVGMGHPSDDCTEETMYRFADFGETKKRDLNAGDIAGIKALYK